MVFLGKLRDLAGTDSAELPPTVDWSSLTGALPPAVARELSEGRVAVACAGHLLADPTELCAAEGDEVALLPPVSGG